MPGNLPVWSRRLPTIGWRLTSRRRSTFRATMQSPVHSVSPKVSRRSFLKVSAVLAGNAPLLAGVIKGQSVGRKALLMAYVGTFSSPLRGVLPTQVDSPPGDGRGIPLFQVDRTP